MTCARKVPTKSWQDYPDPGLDVGIRKQTKAMSMTGREPLADKTIVVTRPVILSQNLLLSLKEFPVKVVHFPAIDIRPVEDPGVATRLLQNLAAYDTVIFNSANAVHHAMPLMQGLQLKFGTQCIATLGPATQAALSQYGVQTDIVPKTGFRSEDLLAQEELQGHTVLIVRGVGGREHLARELRSRGARVDIAEVYRRLCPATRPSLNLCTCPEKESAILIYSVESAHNLWTLCAVDERRWMTRVALIAGSRRIAETATAIGFTKSPIIANNASDAAMLEALQTWARGSS